jgi:DNA/RNA endonuclease G (NUC1)
VEFLSYEGSFTAANGPAAGLTSTNIGVYETGAEPVGQSLQRTGNGTWTGPLTATLGSCNDADEQAAPPVAAVSVTPATASIAVGATQTLAAAATDAAGQTIGGVTYAWSTSAADVATVDPATGVVTAVAPGEATITAAAPNGVSGTVVVTVTAAAANAANVRITELHYDNDGTDAGEAVELEGDAGSSLAGWKLVLYNGTPGTSTSGQPYATLALSGAFLASCDARGVVVAPAAGLQNGDADGVALVDAAGKVVEFLSYEGSFTATAGPAAGMTSTDVGVAQSTTTPAGRSLQRAGNGSWFGPYTSTFGECNPAVPPAPRAGISFSGRLPSDAPLPVGFQDQLFATVRDANTGASIQTTVTWTSETPAVMSVDARGVVTALTAGTGVVRATAADGTTSTLSLPTEVPPFGDAGAYGDQLAAGAPVRAGDAIRVTRAQYALAYSTARNTPLWVAYRLTRANRGDLPGYRCDCFTTDPVVTAGGGAAITTADYTGSGFDRGHMVRSNDRELARGDQAQTYYMSNIVPQYPNLNQGRWGGLETYLQTVSEGAGHPDVYIVAGVRGDAGTIGNGRIVVPTHTWKVALVLPAGVSPATITKPSDVLDVIAVDMPNVRDIPKDTDWSQHRVSVDSVERASGFDLLAALPNSVEEVLESGDRAPTARITGAGLAGGNEGETLSFSAATSSDPDVGGPLDDVLSYQWSVDGAVVGIQSTLAYAFRDNGTYAVRVVVADRFGAADTTGHDGHGAQRRPQRRRVRRRLGAARRAVRGDGRLQRSRRRPLDRHGELRRWQRAGDGHARRAKRRALARVHHARDVHGHRAGERRSRQRHADGDRGREGADRGGGGAHRDGADAGRRGDDLGERRRLADGEVRRGGAAVRRRPAVGRPSGAGVRQRGQRAAERRRALRHRGRDARRVRPAGDPQRRRVSHAGT